MSSMSLIYKLDEGWKQSCF